MKNPPIVAAWHSLWVLQKQHSEPAWARVLACSAMAILLGTVMMLLTGLLTGLASDGNWWLVMAPINLLICLAIANTVLALFRILELSLPAQTLASIAGGGKWHATLLLNALGLAGIVLGFAIAMLLLAARSGRGLDYIYRNVEHQGIHVRMLLFVLVIGFANWFWWRVRANQRAQRQQATESQLRLLQAQIEPHFLFNTLANVQSLIGHDTPGARQMLVDFTDYLRVGLDQLRHADSTLAQELDMARSYLQLFQIRMGERLSYTIDADAGARAAILPPLLLQPLIENAITHGLEPKVEGGAVHIHASVRDGRLEIVVTDDGLGLDAPRRQRRAGNGMALDNIRARLRTRYAGKAELSVTPRAVGTHASIHLPYTAQP
ncbi:sensor histidine kinase [Massilia glaciei]|uniref:Sensor histidine kinase n=1 Tax=Massilia glaciei TaxID=1524097 RepID=A0A2U2HJR3_9BURK|nr:histidine kinase [Massilia glaciei]PWF47778.1 sensor histidine kinase [Massilia glaciei]